MPGTQPVRLHMAQSMEDLNNKCINIAEATINTAAPDRLFRSMCKILEIAEEKLRKGDQEAAYVHFMKYLHVVQVIQKRPDKKSKDWQSLLAQTQVKRCLEQAEVLSKHLGSRYAQLHEKKESNKSQSLPPEPKSVSPAVNGTPAAPAVPAETHYELKVTSRELYGLIGRYRGGPGLLVLDARPAKDYQESRLDAPCVTSVPEEIIEQGLSSHRLGTKLPPSSLALWSQRKVAKYVVLMDWSSHLTDVIPGSKLFLLKTILLKWDVGVVYDREPLVLEGGYEDWLQTYPTVSTNPNVKAPYQDPLMADMLLDDIEYPLLGDILNPKPASAPAIPSINRGTKPSSAPPSLPTSASSYHAANSESIVSVAASEAPASQQGKTVEKAPSPPPQDTPAPAVPAIDRGSKQLAIERMQKDKQKLSEEALELHQERLEFERKMEELRRSKVEEADEEMRQIKEAEWTKEIERLNKLCEKKDVETARLKAQLEKALEGGGSLSAEVTQLMKNTEDKLGDIARQSNTLAKERQQAAALMPPRSTKPSSAPTGLSGGNSSSKPDKKPRSDLEDTQLRFEALKLDHPGTSNLTRSHSSPNIKDLEDAPPQFDRGSKPVARNAYQEPLMSRKRDFSPVFGSRGRGLTGLKNLGNSCYMNSIVQCISNTTSLMQYFCEGSYREEVNINTRTRGQIVEELAAVVRALWGGEYRAIACRDFKRVAGNYHEDFAGFRQQDSHEFLTLLMDWLHDDLNKRRHMRPPPSPAVDPREVPQQIEDLHAAADAAWRDFVMCNESRILYLFYGQQSSTVRCRVCNFESVTFEPFSSLTLVLPAEAEKCTLSECLEMYLAPETVSEWKCPRCKEPRRASKKFDIWRLPAILVIHFKRFYEDVLWRKQHTMVDFPLAHLDMRRFTAETDKKHAPYELYAVSNHYGTMDGGHYTSYSRSSVFNKWYKFDDADVSEISESNVRSNAAYILFYASKNLSSPRTMHPTS